MRKPKKDVQPMSLRPCHKAAMMLLQSEVLASLPNQRWYFPSEAWEFDAWLENGDAFGFFDGDTLCGYGVMTPAEDRPGHAYAGVLGLETAHTFDFHDMLVHPAYRGQGMHTKLLELFEKMARTVGGNAIYATVDPENEASWHNFEKAGYTCLCTVAAYDGRPRRYYQLDLQKKAESVTEAAHD